MKTGLKFGFSAVQAGQKASVLNAIPQLFAKTTTGGFTITAPVSKALGIAVGENVMFLNNIDEIQKAIQNNNPDVLEYAQAAGLDLNTVDGQEAVVKAFTTWVIAKGVNLYNQAGEPLYAAVRVSKADKQAYIDEHGAEVIASLTDEERAAFADAKGVDASDDEALIAALTPDDIPSPKVHDATGSKTSANGNATGVGVQLSFTDTAIWTALKSDMEDKNALNRVFDVDLKTPIVASVPNGNGYVEVTGYPISFVEDRQPTRVGESASEE